MNKVFITAASVVAGCVLSVGVVCAAPANPSGIGDVVARDLSITGLGWAGHVGMYDGSKIVEVLNKSAVIQRNSTTDFKASSPYWGARYGKGSNFSTMVTKGWEQRNYSPSYTSTALWTEGRYKKQCTRQGCKNVLIPAKFRCDTFVNYMYRKGTGSNLVSTFLPVNVYNAMPKTR